MKDALPIYKPVTLDVSSREDVAETRVSFGNSSALSLLTALRSCGQSNEVLLGLFHRISACALRSNHWVGDDLHNEQTGELYAGNGVIWACGSKLCPSCIAKAANRSRKELKLALQNQKLFTGERYQFITLTIPNPNLSLLETRRILDRSWTLFRKRKYFVEKIRGASKSEEFTITKNGYHYHYHLLAVTRFLDFQKFRAEWTDCVRIAHEENNLPFEVNTSDKLLEVKVQRVNPSKNGLKGAIQEVCKYVTKSDSWEKIPEKDLIEIASIKRFWRMVELVGLFRDQRNANAVLTYPHPLITYLIFKTILEALTKLKEILESGHYTILDTKQITDGKAPEFDEFSGNSPPEEKTKRRRQMNWREYIDRFGIDSYLERLANELDSAWECRKSVLRRKYPFASFKTLDGEIF